MRSTRVWTRETSGTCAVEIGLWALFADLSISMVHSRLVSIACEARREDGGGGSQYFLITPKLLNGLEYHPNMKVHCIASGEWMPEDDSSLNFDALARRALAIRAG